MSLVLDHLRGGEGDRVHTVLNEMARRPLKLSLPVIIEHVGLLKSANITERLLIGLLHKSKIHHLM